MNYNMYISIGGTIAMISMLLVYTFIYVLHRERYVKIWLTAWFTHLFRTILFESGIFSWQQSIWSFTVYQILFIGSSLLFIYSIYLFAGRSIRNWLCGAVGASLISVIFTLLQLPIPYKNLPHILFGSVVCVWLGICFLHHLKLTGIGRLITGYAFILWGIVIASFIFSNDGTTPILVISCSILRLIIATGTLLVYFEKIASLSVQIDRMNMVGQMAIRFAHEIRNPLTTISGYLQFSKKRDSISKDYLDLMTEEIDNIAAVINEYILLANKRVEMKSCCLNSIIKASLPLIQLFATTSNVLIKLDLGDVPKLNLAQNEIRQLLLNLIRNGIEAMPSGGELTIHTDLDQDNVVLSVKDQGSGISAHILDNLGVPFLTTKDTENIGTGLGIPTCYRIAERHNANIDIKTNSQGTTFFVYFNLSHHIV